MCIQHKLCSVIFFFFIFPTNDENVPDSMSIFRIVANIQT